MIHVTPITIEAIGPAAYGEKYNVFITDNKAFAELMTKGLHIPIFELTKGSRGGREVPFYMFQAVEDDYADNYMLAMQKYQQMFPEFEIKFVEPEDQEAYEEYIR